MTAQPPLVSVIIPNYNYGDTLGDCIRAAQGQTYPNLEVIVADDCSTDHSVEVARSLGARVVQTPRNGGQAVARNLGATHARGEFLFFLDSDMVLAPDAVANAWELLRSDPEAGAVCGVNDPEPLHRDGLVKEYRALQYHFWLLTPDGISTILASAMFAIRADVFAALGPFDPRLRWSEEVEYGHRISQQCRIYLSTRVRGQHDPDATMRILLRKLFHRGRVRVPLFLQHRKFARGFETGPRAFGSVAALLAVLSIPLVALWGPWWALAPAALLATSILVDLPMYRFVFARRGSGFLLYFTAVHFIVNLTIAASVVAGGLQWLVSGRFRRLYDDCPKASPVPSVAVATDDN